MILGVQLVHLGVPISGTLVCLGTYSIDAWLVHQYGLRILVILVSLNY